MQTPGLEVVSQLQYSLSHYKEASPVPSFTLTLLHITEIPGTLYSDPREGPLYCLFNGNLFYKCQRSGSRMIWNQVANPTHF